MKLNEEYNVIINDIDNNMNGITRIDNFVIFVPYALKDEEVTIKIVDIKKRYAVGRMVKFIKKSKIRNNKVCDKYFECGGCSFLHTTFDMEIECKKKELCKLFNIDNINILTNNEFNYRNKATFHVINGKIGYFSEKSCNLVCFNECMLVDKRINKIYNYLKKCDLYNIDSVIVRVSNNEIMVIFRGNRETFYDNGLFDQVDSVYLNNKLIYGNSYIIMNINGFKYSIYPDAFFQVNTENMKIMYDKVKEYAQSGNNLLDLYCGTGTIGIYLSNNFKSITGIEINSNSIKSANINKKLNNLNNINFICGDAKIASKNNYDVIVVDPPRNGLSKDVIKYLNNSKAKRIVYVSCNPKTLKRDIELLINYNLTKIEGINMFNKTKHVESVCILERKYS